MYLSACLSASQSVRTTIHPSTHPWCPIGKIGWIGTKDFSRLASHNQLKPGTRIKMGCGGKCAQL